jgi:VanZ family protein
MFSDPVRKLAHYTEYLILGILMFLMLKSYGIEDFSLPIVLCIMYACSDEMHQFFVPGRACRVLDVVIDGLGSFTGVFIISLFK